MIKFDLAPIQNDLDKAAKLEKMKCYPCDQFGHMVHKCPIDPKKMHRSKEYWLKKGRRMLRNEGCKTSHRSNNEEHGNESVRIGLTQSII